MVTTVGLENDFTTAIKDLIELDYDAIAAYDAALSRLDNEDYKSFLTSFKEDHERHITELSSFLTHKGEEVPTGPSAKSYLTQGKVILANLIGDETILRAMRSNEIDTNTAYGRINNYKEIPPEIREPLKRGLHDERRHLEWLEAALDITK
jgi:rubrerythrin